MGGDVLKSREVKGPNPADEPLAEAFRGTKAAKLKEWKHISDEKLTAQRKAELTKDYRTINKGRNKKEQAEIDKLIKIVESGVELDTWEPGQNATKTDFEFTRGNDAYRCNFRVIMSNTKGKYILLRSPDKKSYPPAENYAEGNLTNYSENLAKVPEDVEKNKDKNKDSKEAHQEAVNEAALALKVIKALKRKMKGDPKVVVYDVDWLVDDKVLESGDLPAGKTVYLISDKNKDNQIRMFVGKLRA